MSWRQATLAVFLYASCCSEAQSGIAARPQNRPLDLALPPATYAIHGLGPAEGTPAAAPETRWWSPPPWVRSVFARPEDPGSTRYKGSSYVPVDSWVYPALDRLIALGYIQTGSLTILPLTRLECARLVAEAHTLAANYDPLADDSGDVSLLLALDREFAHESHVTESGENSEGSLERVYARYNGIAGPPLRDSFHFGQTLYNDFGRPYGQGNNAIAGFSGHAEHGPFAIYTRAEYQHAASSPAYSAPVQQEIVTFDETREAWQPAPGAALPSVFNFNPAPVDRFRLIEGYAALNLADWQISAGQQSLWWGPHRTTSLILSNNAAAMPMIRIARTTPLELPSLLEFLGPVHFDAFLAREGGIHYVALGETFVLHGDQKDALTPPPYVWGATISVEPTKFLEFAMAHTVIFAGYGRPLTLRTFIHTFNKGGNMQVKDPGKRVTQFSAAYHPPFLRHSVLVYVEGMAWDNPVQGHFTERFAIDPGVYLPHIPFVRKLDLRLEGIYTALPGIPEEGYFYANAHYPQGYTNYGQILGSWIGREGRGGTGTSSFWFSPRTKATATFRRMTANKVMLQGGNMTDISGSFTWLVNPRIEVSTVQQYERWRFPALEFNARSNFSTTFKVELLAKPRP